MKRYQIDMTPAGLKRLEELKAAIDATSNKDLFDEALTLLDWAVTQVQNGRIIASIDEKKNSFRELSMPGLEKARRMARETGTEAETSATAVAEH